MLKEMFENVSKSSLSLISDHMDQFIEQLSKIAQRDSASQEVSWNETFMAFVWTVEEAPALLAELNDHAALFSHRQVQALEQFIQLKPWQLDLQALKEYFECLREPNNDFDGRSMSLGSVRDSVFADDKISPGAFLRKHPHKQRFKAR